MNLIPSAPPFRLRLLFSTRPVAARVAAVGLAVAVAAGTGGCVAVVAAGAAGAGVAWVRGALETDLAADLDRSYRAAETAVEKLELVTVSRKKSAVDAAVLARTALDKRVEIVLKRTGPRSTHVSIRVGVFGDEALALTILERIKAEL